MSGIWNVDEQTAQWKLDVILVLTLAAVWGFCLVQMASIF